MVLDGCRLDERAFALGGGRKPTAASLFPPCFSLTRELLEAGKLSKKQASRELLAIRRTIYVHLYNTSSSHRQLQSPLGCSLLVTRQ